MKNILNYYYHMIVNDSDIENGYFTYNNYHFCLLEYKRNIGEVNALVSVNNDMLNNDILVNRIIFNIHNEPITFYNNVNYYLLMIESSNQNIGYRPVEAIISDKTKILMRNNWDYLWSSKIDYIEYQLSHLENSYPVINNSVNYFIGLTENAIIYFKMLQKDKLPLFYNHRRITKDNLYNPMEIIIDYKVRDISEYLKELFIFENKSINDIMTIIKKLSFDYYDYLLFYVRMLYPSFYFDLYEEIINNNVDEEKIQVVIDKIPMYEELLFEIYRYINTKYNILGIEWINRKFM